MRKRPDPVYRVWGAMIQRCTNKKNKQYKDYGGRGIEVCERWRDPKLFMTDMGPRPPGMTLERKNNNKGYNPDNCCWVTRKEQNSNKRNCIYIVMHQGRRITLREYCRRHDLPYRPIVKRIQDRGWPIELALHIPVGEHRGENVILSLWDQNQELRQYLQLALEALQGRPVLDRIIDEAQLLCDAAPKISLLQKVA